MPGCVREDGADGASTRASSPSPDLHSNGASTTDILEEEAFEGIVVRTVPVPQFSQVSSANVRAISQAVGEGHSREPLVEVVATILIKLTACFEHRETIPTRFHCVRAPQISLHDYLQRIAKFLLLQPSMFCRRTRVHRSNYVGRAYLRCQQAVCPQACSGQHYGCCEVH